MENFSKGGRKPSLETARERFVKDVFVWLKDGGCNIAVDFKVLKPYTIDDVVAAYMKYEEELTSTVVKATRKRVRDEEALASG
jgi:GTP:adenosylcobinamide-phosphate guanylyltransferase